MRAIFDSLARDLRGVAIAFALSMAAGWGLNMLRGSPVAFPYRSREARVQETVKGKGRNVPGIGLPDVKDALRDRSAVFVDARSSFFYEDGHLPGAINLPVSQVIEGKIAGLPDDRSAKLIVYCSGGDCEDSKTIARALTAGGYSNVSIYSGGWDEWSAPRK